MRKTARSPLASHLRTELRRWRARFILLPWRGAELWRRWGSAQNLRNFERRVHSQNGEDGIIAEIFRRIGTTNRYFVEFGIQDGSECNCRHLVATAGWSGLWMEGASDLARAAQSRFAGFPVQVRQAFVTRENVVDLLRQAAVPHEPDLMSIDIDGNDYWIWEALARDYAPRVVVIEYNATHVPGVDWVMPYRADHVWDGSNYYGASLDALNRLAEQLGYVLVGCDSRGVNSFFVRKAAAGRAFPDAGRGTRYHYVAPKFGLDFGHPPRRG